MLIGRGQAVAEAAAAVAATAVAAATAAVQTPNVTSSRPADSNGSEIEHKTPPSKRHRTGAAARVSPYNVISQTSPGTAADGSLKLVIDHCDALHRDEDLRDAVMLVNACLKDKLNFAQTLTPLVNKFGDAAAAAGGTRSYHWSSDRVVAGLLGGQERVLHIQTPPKTVTAKGYFMYFDIDSETIGVDTTGMRKPVTQTDRNHRYIFYVLSLLHEISHALTKRLLCMTGHPNALDPETEWDTPPKVGFKSLKRDRDCGSSMEYCLVGGLVEMYNGDIVLHRLRNARGRMDDTINLTKRRVPDSVCGQVATTLREIAAGRSDMSLPDALQPMHFNNFVDHSEFVPDVKHIAAAVDVDGRKSSSALKFKWQQCDEGESEVVGGDTGRLRSPVLECGDVHPHIKF